MPSAQAAGDMSFAAFDRRAVVEDNAVRPTLEGGNSMSIILAETYMVRHEEQKEFQSSLEEFIRYKERHPKLFESVKSWRLLKQFSGGIANAYVELWEFDSLLDMEKCSARIFKTKEGKKIQADFYDQIDNATFTRSIWNSVA
jgi:hypothetical protein